MIQGESGVAANAASSAEPNVNVESADPLQFWMTFTQTCLEAMGCQSSCFRLVK